MIMCIFARARTPDDGLFRAHKFDVKPKCPGERLIYIKYARTCVRTRVMVLTRRVCPWTGGRVRAFAFRLSIGDASDEYVDKYTR